MYVYVDIKVYYYSDVFVVKGNKLRIVICSEV